MDENDLSLEHAKEVFDHHGLTYDVKLGGSMMWVRSKQGKVYGYYPTTHRWSPRHLRGKHYRAKSTEDFIQRFVLKGDEKKEKYLEIVKEKFGVDTDKSSMSDLVFYIWDCFEGGASKTQALSEVQDMMWNHVREVCDEQTSK